MEEKFAVGVDLGGTSVKTGIVSPDGKLITKSSLPTGAKNGPEFIISQISKTIENVLSKNSFILSGIGIGSPGLIEQKSGTVYNPPNFPGWEKVELGKIISEKFRTRVYVDNDANAAAVGELIYGAGRELKNFIMVTLGTGVGGGLILNKKIFRGQKGAAGEIGHITVNYKGKKCNCGSRGCIEAYVGNSYLISDVKKKLRFNRDSKIIELIGNDLSELTPEIICSAEKLDDAFAKDIIKNVGTILGCGLASVVNLLDVKNIIIGGGVAGFGKPLYKAVHEAVVERVMKPFKESIRIIPAQLKNEAGIKGASSLVFYSSLPDEFTNE